MWLKPWHETWPTSLLHVTSGAWGWTGLMIGPRNQTSRGIFGQSAPPLPPRQADIVFPLHLCVYVILSIVWKMEAFDYITSLLIKESREGERQNAGAHAWPVGRCSVFGTARLHSTAPGERSCLRPPLWSPVKERVPFILAKWTMICCWKSFSAGKVGLFTVRLTN